MLRYSRHSVNFLELQLSICKFGRNFFHSEHFLSKGSSGHPKSKYSYSPFSFRFQSTPPKRLVLAFAPAQRHRLLSDAVVCSQTCEISSADENKNLALLIKKLPCEEDSKTISLSQNLSFCRDLTFYSLQDMVSTYLAKAFIWWLLSICRQLVDKVL